MVGMSRAYLLAERDVLTALKGDVALTAPDMVPASAIYGIDPPVAPSWPFAKTTAPQGLPLNAACVRGAVINFGLSAFTRGRGGVETARDHIVRIGEAIENCLDGRNIEILDVGRIAYTLADVLIRADGDEPGAMHFSTTIRARVLGEVAQS